MRSTEMSGMIMAMEMAALGQHHRDLRFGFLLAIATFVAGLVIGSFF